MLIFRRFRQFHDSPQINDVAQVEPLTCCTWVIQLTTDQKTCRGPETG